MNSFIKEFTKLMKNVFRIFLLIIGLTFLLTAISCLKNSEYEAAISAFVLSLILIFFSKNLFIDYIERIKKEKSKKYENKKPATNSDFSNISFGLACKHCGSDNISVQMIQTGSKTKKMENSEFQKATHNATRFAASFTTLGVSNLFIPKKLHGQEKTKTKLEKFCICQNCGHSWKIF